MAGKVIENGFVISTVIVARNLTYCCVWSLAILGTRDDKTKYNTSEWQKKYFYIINI